VSRCGNNSALHAPVRTFADPVLAADGMTYDRPGIVQWFKNKSTSPSTGSDLPHKRLLPNRSIKCLIDAWHATHGACWTLTPSKQTVPQIVPSSEPTGTKVQPPPLPSGSTAVAPMLPAAAAPSTDLSDSAGDKAAVTPSAPSERAAMDVHDTQSAVQPSSVAAAAASASGGDKPAPLPSSELAGSQVPDDAVVHVRQNVADSGIMLRCEEVRPGGDETRAYVRWMVKNEHPSHQGASVTLTWKAENQFAAYNYTLPDAPITCMLQPGGEAQVYYSDKIIADFVFGGSGAEWEYTWKLV